MGYNILIIKLSAIGDVTHTLPFLEVLRANYPDSRIDWLIEKGASEIIEGHELINNVLISDRKSWQKRLSSLEGFQVVREAGKFLKTLRQIDYDIVIDLQGLLKSGLLMFLAKGKRKIGFTGSREGARFFLNEKPFYVDYDQHASDRYLKTIDYLGGSVGDWKGLIPLQDSDQEFIDSFIHEYNIVESKLITVNPISKWQTKLWVEERYSELADRLINELSLDVVFTGNRDDRPVIDSMISRMGAKAYNLAGETSLKELAYLFSKCQAMIGMDTGPLHMAVAMKCPVIALFGPTAPCRTGPYGDGHIVIRDEMDCSPCFKKRCDHKSCMKNISVDTVFETVKRLLF